MDINIRIAEVFPNLNELLSNKYVITILVAYYALTRMITTQEAAIYLSKESSVKLIFEEIIRYLAGETIYIEAHEKDLDVKRTVSLVLGMPVYSSEDFLDMIKIQMEKMASENKIEDSEPLAETEEEPRHKVKKKKIVAKADSFSHPDIMSGEE